jgi:hypothetical protein
LGIVVWIPATQRNSLFREPANAITNLEPGHLLGSPCNRVRLRSEIPWETSGPATGTIVVYRTWKFSGGGRSLPVILDGQPRIKLENGCYWAFVVSPGDHALLRTGDFGVKDKIQVHVESSQTVYVDAHYGGWATIFEVAEDQDEARQQVAKLKQQTSTR